MTQLIDGLRVGHWTDREGATGCTVVLLPEGTVASGEVRGGAPATREFALLDPQRMIEHVDAVVLSGGSAFGLAAADGVMAELADRGRGFVTEAGTVPIVVGMALFDLMVGGRATRPGPDAGRAALAAITTTPETGSIGAGTGATVGKWRGQERRRPGGLGIATIRAGDLGVTAIVAVNAAGDIDDGSVSGAVAAGTFDDWPPPVDPGGEDDRQNTTIGVIVTDAKLTKLQCRLVAESGHDGLGRAIFPAHMVGDGDALVAAATGIVEADLRVVRALATVAVERAVRSVPEIGV